MFRLAMGVSFDEKSEKQLGVPLVIFLLFFFSKCEVPLGRQGSIEAAYKWLQS